MTLDDLERPKRSVAEKNLIETNCTGTVGFYCLLVLKIYKRKNKMFAFDETKEYVFIKIFMHIHVVGSTCMLS